MEKSTTDRRSAHELTLPCAWSLSPVFFALQDFRFVAFSLS
jgi:hypothetical protein